MPNKKYDKNAPRPWRRTGRLVACRICSGIFYKNLNGTRVYCSNKCFRSDEKLKIRLAAQGFQPGKTACNKGKKFPDRCGENHHNWKNGIVKHSCGYIQRLVPIHPFANKKGYVFEHRLVMENKIGRYLNKKEVVHHINEDKSDNRIENLQLFASSSEHLRIAHKVRKRCRK